MHNDFDRLQARLPMEMLSMKRYELPQPSAGRMNDISAWTECVENSQAQLEHQSLRISNLDLMSQYGADAWKMYNGVLQQMLELAQKQLVDIRKQMQEINWERKNKQTVAGTKLKQLEESWVGLVSKNYEIERACVDLENELEEMKQRTRKRARKS